jgi:hypothetical protein
MAQADRTSGVACNHCPGRDGPVYYGAGTYNGSRPDPGAGTDKSLGTNPRLLTNLDGELKERQLRLSVVMRSGAQMGPVRNGRTRADDNQSGVVDPGVLRKRAPVSDPQVPGKQDSGGGENPYMFADSRTEAA